MNQCLGGALDAGRDALKGHRQILDRWYRQSLLEQLAQRFVGMSVSSCSSERAHPGEHPATEDAGLVG